MEQKNKKSLRTCGCCLKKLPFEAFYINKRTQNPDNYCKECRKATCRKRYHRTQISNDARSYPVITETNDYNLRMTLILHARQVVRESIERKRRSLRETAID